jgi:chromate transporter
MKKQWYIFLAFFRVGMLGYGGGPSSIPLVHKEVVDKYKWMDDDEFGDILALGNALPGPIATKMAGYIGYRVSGILGMLNALLASIMPTIILMIVLLTTLSNFREFDWVQGMTAAVLPVVGMMMSVLTWQFFEKAGKGMGWVTALIVCAFVFVLLQLLGVHPGILIAAFILYALLKKDKKSPGREGDNT